MISPSKEFSLFIKITMERHKSVIYSARHQVESCTPSKSSTCARVRYNDACYAGLGWEGCAEINMIAVSKPQAENSYESFVSMQICAPPLKAICHENLPECDV
jgi:hypothetical protein